MVSFNFAGVKVFVVIFRAFRLEIELCFSALVLNITNCRLELLRDEFSQKVSASVSTKSFLVVLSVLFFYEVFETVGCFFFSRDFFNHHSDCVCSGGGAELIDVVLSKFLLGFLYGCSCFENFEAD